MGTKNKTAVDAAQEPVFTKEALLNCKRFRKEHDLVSALLEDDKCYSVSEVDKKIVDYMKGKVK